MENKKKMGYVRFIAEHIFWGALIWLFYINTVFRPLDSRTDFNSRFILFQIVAIVSLFSCVQREDENKTLITVLADLCFGFGIYTIMSYFSIAGVMMTIIIVICAVPTAAYFVYLMTAKNKTKLKLHRVLYLRLKKFTGVSVGMISSVFSVMLAVLFLITFPAVVYDLYNNDEAIAVPFEESLKENYSELECFSDDSWENASRENKIEMLRAVCRVEAETLGIEELPGLKDGKMNENKLGYYDGAEKTIYLNLDSLEKYSRWIAVNTLCHEMYHTYQHRLVEFYLSSDKKFRKLEVMQKANIYMHEFMDYNPAEDDYGKYYNQHCEEDAREYASARTVKYYSCIMKSLPHSDVPANERSASSSE